MDIKYEVLAELEITHSKHMLCHLFRLSERAVRLCIAELRNEGEAIISTSKKQGYKLLDPNNENDLRDGAIMYRETMSRIKKLLSMIKPVEKILVKKGIVKKRFNDNQLKLMFPEQEQKFNIRIGKNGINT